MKGIAIGFDLLKHRIPHTLRGHGEPPFRFEPPLEPKNLTEGEIIEKAKKSRPKDQLPEGEGGIDQGRSNCSIPVNKPQDKYKEEKKEGKSFQRTIIPKVPEPDNEEGEEFPEEIVLFLKLLNLVGLLFRDLGMKFLLLNIDSVTIETDIFLT